MPRLIPCLAIAVAIASCGGDDEPTTAESPPPTATETVTTTETGSTPTTGTTTESQSGDCGTQGAYTVKVVRGEVPCETAKSTVAGYDPAGAKVQEVGAYTCEGGEAAVKPLVFTCVAGDNEITASEP